MSDLYEVLGLPRGANEQQVKTAYRTLARRFHPDVNAGDETAEQRFKEVSLAYETLGHPQEREAYDRNLARRSAEARRRYWQLTATAAATFVLTTSSVSLAVLWRQHAGGPQSETRQAVALAQKGAHDSKMAMAPLQDSAEAGVSPHRSGRVASWTTYQNARFGFALRYPAGVFAADTGQGNDNVHAFVSRDGRAVLRIFATENAAGTTPAKYRRSLIEDRYAGAVFDQTLQRKFWFVLSGTRGGNVFHERITFSCDGKSMHGWQMTYPLTERRSYDGIAKLVYRNYPHGNGPGARCGEAKPRTLTRRAQG